MMFVIIRTMEMKIDRLFLMVAFLGLSCCVFADEAKPAENAAQEKKTEAVQAEADKFDLLEAIGLLRSNSVVLEVGDKKLAWLDVYPFISPVLRNNQKESDRSRTEKIIHDFFQSVAARGLLLSEAESMGITVNDEERKEFEADLEKNLEGNDRGMTKEKFIASFNKKGSNMASLSFDDVLKLIKLDKIKFGDVAISDHELALYIRYLQAMNDAIKQKNDETKKHFASLLNIPDINTDDGFMNVAREYSEGRESDNGGVLDYDFTREDLAEINDLKSFDWKVGETTPVFETENDLRIMRILAAIPPEKKGEPEKYRVAQILHGKIALMDVKNKDAIRAEMLSKKKKKAIDDFVVALQSKFKVSSCLFPNGIWESEEQKQSTERTAKQGDIDKESKNEPQKQPENKK